MRQRNVIVLLAALSISGAGLLPAQPASAAASASVAISAPVYDAPGAVVPVIVTGYGVAAGSSLALSAPSGGAASCQTATWTNPKTRATSKLCYATLPRRTGTFNFVARLSSAGRVYAAAKAIRATGYITSPLRGSTINSIAHCYNTGQQAWLTFDDFGSFTQVKRIVDTLDRNGVRGRFFWNGLNARASSASIAYIKRRGHIIENHTYDHAALNTLSAPRFAYEVLNGARTSTGTKLLRPPYGAGSFSYRAYSLAAQRGYKLCRWTADTSDWDGTTPSQMYDKIRYGDSRTPPLDADGVVLMHMRAPYTSIGGVQAVIDAARARGVRLASK